MFDNNHNIRRDLALDDLISGLGATILKSIRTPFGIFDTDFRILWINDALARIHRCEAEAVIGDICYRAFHGCDKVCGDCFLGDVKERGRTVVLERSHVFPNGTTRWGEIHAYPVRGQDRSVAAIVVIIFDTTRRIRRLDRQKQYASELAAKLQTTVDLGESNVQNKSAKGLEEELSKREREVLGLIVDGYTNPQISTMLSISSNTVKRHISNLFLKLGVTDRTQAAVLAVRENLL